MLDFNKRKTPPNLHRLAALIAFSTALLFPLFPKAQAQTTRHVRLPLPQNSAIPDGIVVLRSKSSPHVHLPATSFPMGSRPVDLQIALSICRQELLASRCTDDLFKHELANHAVALPSYWIDRTEVSVQNYLRCAHAGQCETPLFEQGASRFRQDTFPVTMVSWSNAKDYCRFVGGRLPTEAEWERAARGPTGRRFPWGEQVAPHRTNHGRLAVDENDDSDGFAELAPVGSFPDGQTLEGVHDLAGNVAEWVEDIYEDAYEALPVSSPKGPSYGAFRVIRGGSYVHAMAFLRSTARDYRPPSAKLPYVGFRCVYDAPPIFD